MCAAGWGCGFAASSCPCVTSPSQPRRSRCSPRLDHHRSASSVLARVARGHGGAGRPSRHHHRRGSAGSAAARAGLPARCGRRRNHEVKIRYWPQSDAQIEESGTALDTCCGSELRAAEGIGERTQVDGVHAEAEFPVLSPQWNGAKGFKRRCVKQNERVVKTSDAGTVGQIGQVPKGEGVCPG